MSDAGPSAETLTLMMTDVEGSTALRRTRGDGLADEILGLHGAIVRDQLGRYGGQERQFLGDGFLLSFPSPVAAVRCAVGIQSALAKHNASDTQREVRVRIGIHAKSASAMISCMDRRCTWPPASLPRQRAVRSSYPM